MTFKEILIEDISHIPPEKFKDPETFFGEGRRGVAYFTAMHSAFTQLPDIFTKEKLSKIIFEFLGKWPYNSRSQLAHIASSIVYYEHYERAHKHKPPKSVIERIERNMRELDLRDEEPKFEKKHEKKSRRKNVGDEIAIKLKDMGIEEIVAWEKEIGVDKEIIKKHKTLFKKNAGLARMNIANKIRFVLRPKTPE